MSVLAIDAGQTGVKLRLTRHGADDLDWSAPGIRTDRPLVPQLSALLDDAVLRKVQADAIGIGVSGLTDRSVDAQALLNAASGLGASSLSLAHDSITAYLGALGNERGVVVAAGTGVVTLGVGRSKVARVDGWGYLMGDVGSGYWIGRAALEAVMRQFDGRGPGTALTEIILAEFPTLGDAYIELQGDDGRVSRIARFARYVAEVAATDAVAAGIIASASTELAQSALTALHRVGEASAAEPNVHAVGGVFRSSLVANSFADEIRSWLPHARVLAGHAHPLDGAVLLQQVGTSDALHSSVVRAEVAI